MIDTNSPTWVDVKLAAATALDSAREENDAPETSPERTQYLRGRVALAKEILGLPEEQKKAHQIDAPEAEYE